MSVKCRLRWQFIGYPEEGRKSYMYAPTMAVSDSPVEPQRADQSSVSTWNEPRLVVVTCFCVGMIMIQVFIWNHALTNVSLNDINSCDIHTRNRMIA